MSLVLVTAIPHAPQSNWLTQRMPVLLLCQLLLNERFHQDERTV